MKIKKKISKKKIIIPIIILVSLLVGGTTWAYAAQVGPFAKEQAAKHESKKSQVKKKDKKIKEDPKTGTSAKDSPQSSESPSSEDKTLQPSPNNNSSGSPEKPSITTVEQSGNTIRVSAMFSKSSSGSCLLKISKSGQTTIQKLSPIIVGPSYYACNGFRLNRSEFPASGKWDVVVVHQRDGKSAESNREVLDVQ